MFTRIESERLILRRFEDSDLIPFVAYRNDPEVARYQSWDSCDEQEAKVLIREMGSARVGVPGKWFGFPIESNETGMLVGDCALRVDEHEPYRAESTPTTTRCGSTRTFSTPTPTSATVAGGVTMGTATRMIASPRV
jgi:RimJ/RimL family protein N-acetyltransferase